LKILAVGAHPDDVEIGCGATLALFKEKRHEVHILVLTRGEASGDPRIREEECKQSTRSIGADRLFFGSLADTRISDGIDTIKEIENVIDLVKPDIVFSHSSKDSHQDHRNTSLASLSAARRIDRVLLYESPAALREFCPQVFVDVSSMFSRKLEALSAFNSQRSKTYLETKDSASIYRTGAIEGLARFRGFQVGVSLAEAYEVGRFILEV
jgi:LmbE family N-acetylglucosaminyl deacetylase